MSGSKNGIGKIGWRVVAVTLLCGCVLSAPLSAQTSGGPGAKYQFDQTAADLAQANGFTYREYRDGATTGTVLTVSCVAGASATTFTCTAAIPAITPGNHTVQFTAANVGGESVKSTAFAFQIVAVPSAPTNTRIVP